MALTGYVEAVEPFQVRGWIYDTASPRRSLTVEILLRDQPIGSTSASLYREDLEQSGIGSGDHAFIFNSDQKLDPSDIQHVSARAFKPDGSSEIVHMLSRTDTIFDSAKPLLHFEGLTSDSEQHPVIVLGAARSGTSAIAQALLKLSRFSGQQEGHLLDLMAHFSVALNKFYIEKTDDCVLGRDTMVSFVPKEFFQNTLNEMFIGMIRRMFPEGAWVDKTPNSNMVYLAPRLRQIWPNSRFIFMKRRPLENLVSRAAKFPAFNFAHHCREWNQIMSAWLNVRRQFEGVAIEIDQKFLMDKPGETAWAIKPLLNLSDVEADRLYQAFQFDHPERTSVNQKSDNDISNIGWGDKELEEFTEICAGSMAAYGYSTGAEYFMPRCEANGLVWV